MDYRVTWSIDVEADAVKAAARYALKVQRDPDSIATVFVVEDDQGHRTSVDLTEDSVNALHPNLRQVTFLWSTQHGTCRECGLPAAFYLPLAYVRGRDVEQPPTEVNKRCAVCAANAAADGEKVRRIDQVYVVTDGTLEGPNAILGRFATEDEASRYIATLPDYPTGRYGLDGPEQQREGSDERAHELREVRAGNVRLGVDQPVLLVWGDPAEGFRFVGPVVPNDPELDRFVDQELRQTTWWYLPLRTLGQAWQGND